MNNQRKLVLGIIMFAVLLVAASIAYRTLSENYTSENQAQALKASDAGSNSSTETNNVGSPNSASGSNSSKQQTRKAPDFTIYNGQGNPVKLSDFIGKPVVLNFWASWCPPCKSEMPHFNDAYSEYKDTVVFIMVDLTDGQRETQAKGQAYVSQQGYSFPVYFDTKQSAALAYNIASIPSTFLIDSNGGIVKNYQGAIDKTTLIRGIQDILPNK